MEPSHSLVEVGKKEPSNITSLPTEIRVKIYRELLTPQALLFGERNIASIEIDDLSPGNYKIGIESGSIIHRTRYHPQPAQDLRCACPVRNSGPCKELWPQLQTSYTHTGHDLHVGILSVTKKLSCESLDVFYSQNTFHFKSMSAVLPFLEDRRRSWPFIKRLSFFLPLDSHGHASWKHQEYVQTFDRIATSPTLNLTSVSLTIDDFRRVGLEPNGRQQGVLRWLENVGKVQNLKHLKIDVSSVDGDLVRGTRDEDTESMYDRATHCDIETKIWCYLAPKVMKAERVRSVNSAVAAFRRTFPLIFDPENPSVYHWD